MTLKKSLKHFLAGIALSAITAACSAGRNFVPPEPGSLKLGETSYSEFTSRYGEPRTVGSKITNGLRVKTTGYSYVETQGSVLLGSQVQGRQMSASFWKDKLVGYLFTSSFSNDNTAFDDSQVSKIKRGTWSYEDVIKAFGEPNGKGVYPLVRDEKGRYVQYMYLEPRSAYEKIKGKSLTIEIDGNGKVMNFALNKLGS